MSVSLLKPKDILKFLLSVHAWTLEANTMYFASELEGQEVYNL